MLMFLAPVNEVCEGYVFTSVCHSVHRKGSASREGSLHPGGWANPPLHPSDTMGYGQRAGGTHPTGMHFCNLR